MKRWMMLIPLTWLTGCLPVRSSSSVVGKYLYKADFASATLTLNADFTYWETYAPTEGMPRQCSGRWNWNQADHHVEFLGKFILPSYVKDGLMPPYCDEAGRMAAMRDRQGVYLEENPDSDTGEFRKVQ